MPTRTKPRKTSTRSGSAVPATGRHPTSPKKAKTYRLSESKIRAAQAILGAGTATATIETALDMVVFRQELIDGTAAMLGVTITAV